MEDNVVEGGDKTQPGPSATTCAILNENDSNSNTTSPLILLFDLSCFVLHF